MFGLQMNHYPAVCMADIQKELKQLEKNIAANPFREVSSSRDGSRTHQGNWVRPIEKGHLVLVFF